VRLVWPSDLALRPVYAMINVLEQSTSVRLTGDKLFRCSRSGARDKPANGPFSPSGKTWQRT
jgi:hypothetical protein